MRKGVKFEWDQQCEEAFEDFKRYLLKPPVLGAPEIGSPLILYIVAQETSLGVLLAQNKLAITSAED